MVLPPLYKYLDVHGAKLTLGNRTFKHARPSDFNDTEDVTVQSLFPERFETAMSRLATDYVDVIIQHVNDPPTCASPFKEMLEAIQHVFRKDPAAADLVKSELTTGGGRSTIDVEKMRGLANTLLEELNEHLQRCRIFCVTTHKASEKMWCRYAERHKGVALRIEPNLAKDSKFQLFRPVIYRETRPPLYENTLDFAAFSWFGDREANLKAMIEKIVYAKTLNWKYEGEYRLFIPMLETDEPWDTRPYHPEEVTELHLGLAMEKLDKEEIIDMARQTNPDIAIHQARRNEDGKLRFDPV